MKKIIPAMFIGIVLSVACPQALRANDTGLYDPAAPKDSVFIRFVNMEAEERQFALNGKIRAAGGQEVTPYYFTHAGKDELAAGDVKKQLHSQPGEFYTAVFSDGGFMIIRDESFNNDLKCRVTFYNLDSENKAGLSTADGKIEIVPPIEPWAAQGRLMNPVSLAFAAYIHGDKYAATEMQALERGDSYSVFLLKGAGKLIWIKDSVDTRK